MGQVERKNCKQEAFERCNRIDFVKNYSGDFDKCFKEEGKRCSESIVENSSVQDLALPSTASISQKQILLNLGIIGVGFLVGYGISKYTKQNPVLPIIGATVGLYGVLMVADQHYWNKVVGKSKS